MVNTKQMFNFIIHHLEAFLQNADSQLRSLHNNIIIIFMC